MLRSPEGRCPATSRSYVRSVMTTQPHRRRRVAAVAVLITVVAIVAGACGSNNNKTASSSASSTTAKAAAPACAPGSISGAGSTFVQTIAQQWIKGYAAACSSATVNYQSVGSGAGIQQFTAGTVDFAGSDVVMKPEEQTAAEAKVGPVLHIPVVVGRHRHRVQPQGRHRPQAHPRSARRNLRRQDHELGRRGDQSHEHRRHPPDEGDPGRPPLRRLGHDRRLHDLPDQDRSDGLDVRRREGRPVAGGPGRQGFRRRYRRHQAAGS